jgi:hypothetical protein
MRIDLWRLQCKQAVWVVTLTVTAVSNLWAGSWKVEATYELPSIPLSGFLEEHTGQAGINDHNIKLGGIGSDLWHSRENDGPGIYWMITDRGPNGEDPRTFAVPEFTPFILKVRTANGTIEILEAIPVTGLNGSATGVTGIPNMDNTAAPPAPNESFFSCGGVTQLTDNPHGLDTEGIIRTSDGTFWVVEEYSPSIVKIGADGQVIKRFFPLGLPGFFTSAVTDYLSDDSILSVPEIYGQKRKLNRGFEGIALSPDEETIYIALQSPLRNPDNATGDDSRNTRILAFDLASEQVVAEYVYRFQFTGPTRDDDEFDVPSLPGNTGRARPRDMKVSALAALDEHRLLVLERTDFKAKIYRVDLRMATNILGTVWDDVSTAPSLEAVNAEGALEAAGVTPLPKEFVLTLDSTQGFPQKIEGMTVLDGKTIAIANDNDFGVGSFADPTGACTLVDSGLTSKIIVVGLDQPLKK